MKAYAITDIGKKRSFNQDYAWMTTDEIGKLPNLFIVADGMGGHRGSQMLYSSVKKKSSWRT